MRTKIAEEKNRKKYRKLCENAVDLVLPKSIAECFSNIY